MGGYIGATAVGLVTTAADVQGDITSTDTTPEVILKNTTETDADGSRDGKITFKGEQSGGEESTLAQIQSSHDGTSDDQKGDLIFKTNDGSDGASPTTRMTIDSAGQVTITTPDNGTQLTLESTDADAAVGPVLDLFRNSASPTNFDILGKVLFSGEDNGGNKTEYAHLQAYPQTVTGGAESGYFEIHSLVGGTDRVRMEANATEVVINNPGIDSDFRVESDNDANALFVQGSDGNVGIGTSSPSVEVSIAGSDPQLCLWEGNDGASSSKVQLGTGTAQGFINVHKGDGTRTIQLNSDGDSYFNGVNVLVGKTTTSFSTAGSRLTPDGGGQFVVSGGACVEMNRLSSDGTLMLFQKDGSTVGSIGTFSSRIYIGTGDTGLGFSSSTDAIFPVTAVDGSTRDDAVDLGRSAIRFDNIFATNGTIGTSDKNEKQNISSLTTAEITAATAISKLFKTFKWNSAVVAKGDNARTHTGVIAQQVQTAMSDAKLDASKYAFWCSDTWWEKDVEVAAVEAVEAQDAVYDEEGNLVSEAVEAVEAKDAYTRTDTYETKDEAPDGATERTRLGVRYPELLAFIGAATEQRLTSIESRLTALEG